MIIYSKHPTSQHAWEWLNEYLVTQEEEVIAKGGFRKGPNMVSYDHFMDIAKSWVDPEFCFGEMFGYKMAKWTKLISNYVDFDFLDIVKSQVLKREQKKHPSYTEVFKFSNTHSSGHACLISLIFSRRDGYDTPVIVMSIRSSEVTKRLLMDFVLVDRIIEYVYGENHGASLKIHITNAYIAGETFVMYHNHRDLYKLLDGNDTEIATRVLKILDKYSKPGSVEKITYKSHQRSAKRLLKYPTTPLKAKDLSLFPYKIEYPEDVITDRERNRYKQKLKKQKRKTINKQTNK